MKRKALALFIGLTISTGALAANKSTSSDLEQRLNQLEQRLIAAEQRAATAEAEIQQIKTTPKPAQTTAPVQVVSEQSVNDKADNQSPKLSLTGYGDLKIYGDVEFNMDAASRSNGLTSVRRSANTNWADGNNERWDINGRLLLGFDGYRRMENGQFAGFSAQPLADLTGDMNLDDAVFFFGQENDWKIKVGRFEAYDMFPLNQDTFVEYSGNTANDLYGDGFGYIYMMKEGRGRSDSGGSFLMSKTIDNWYFEFNTLLEDGTSLYQDKSYHGNELTKDKNVAYLRPVISWSQDEFSVAAAMEAQVVDNAYGYKDANGQMVDQSSRTGYGLTMTWNGLKSDPDNGIVANFNTAYLDAADETDFTAGVNALWQRFELGYIYAHNDIDKFDVNSAMDTCEDDCWITNAGTYDIHTIHTSYQFPNVMGMKNFNIYLGTYVSWVSADNDGSDSDDNTRYGGRVRFKYYF
ncbi:porin [Buttiauxella sp. 3AFRM03]|uniref:carbohydrate porin n=1 Tax=unclassified Buttiauxella TaxID=2634062 RepID=UPI000EF794AD|nr:MULTISPECIES: carbohydrate porin [unclassified Buttiauxella]AYN28797.1 porin [Buttiauxella sp. 3AFRM03]TDN53178.1 raffinose porin [Buttiauxella sp. JUb87]